MKARREANRRRMQLRHWLLLAMRCLLIAAVAAALARPTLKGAGLRGKEGAPLAIAMVLDNSQFSLGTADMPTARRYSALAADGEAVFREIEEEYRRTVGAVLGITGQGELLEKSPILARSIKLRNPYVDALHIAQTALLRRLRALPDDAPEVERAALLDAVHHSINGIAAGLQTTG